MRVLGIALILALVLAAAPGCAPGSGARAAVDSSDVFRPSTGLHLVEVARGLESPVYVTAPAGDPRLFVVEQVGRVRIIEGGSMRQRPFIDLTDRVRSGGERGLLSIAFHPSYRTNGYFFVNYTNLKGDTRVERYRVTRDPNVADPTSASLVLAVDQPYSNHNGGHVLFGPDRRLYVGMGDGGAAGDPHDHGQNSRSLLGKMLRIDVDTPGAVPEIWAIGLRNPWRFAFDVPAGLLYIADVGQDKWEEIDVVPLDRKGMNYGWNLTEGRHNFRPRGRSTRGLVRPVVEYGRGDGCSVTGGFVYRGRAMPDLAGTYFFSDYCQGWIKSFRMKDGQPVERRQWRGLDAGNVTSFGLDGAGELYLTNANGKVLRFARGRSGG